MIGQIGLVGKLHRSKPKRCQGYFIGSSRQMLHVLRFPWAYSVTSSTRAA